ncbi:Glycerol-3-phosphate O-acyltransferase / dihydroxyacetone phosphate acyltransferase [Gigaspora margarita]|uniref:Glycerol-3-phosphate O-acyltransferase / dihydroxyacetone phosphate acyltransferase n=1 Tax=Gigaspora margarita TaxID=4874 RepID=A0A8H4A1E7_GIGMA|nr:Glycerol-3-phosphate O-acyltransferase / dihydroxyacetone phosphate acyltransferase [Gigaspora margarita]
MAPLAYRFVRFLFKVLANAFYAIEVEGLEYIPPDGCPTILCPNHANSLTDPICLLAAIPKDKRDMVRLTAKDTFWYKTDVFSVLIRSLGTVPIKRTKDYNFAKVDNSESFEKLIESLEQGDCICMFPEGISRYHSKVAPFKPGVALIASETLTRNKDTADFSINLLTASLVYIRREKFRSNVLVKFNPPIVLTPQHQALLKTDTPDGKRRTSEQAINELTSVMEETIRSNTLDSPDWQILRIAHTARKLYAGDLGTRISLAEYVRLTKKFVNALANANEESSEEGQCNGNNEANNEHKEIIVERVDSNVLHVDDPAPKEKITHQGVDINILSRDLAAYQDLLDSYGIKDYRFSRAIPLSKPELIGRILIRVIWASVLATISSIGIILWSPIFICVKYKEYQIRKLPKEDNYDEITQYKLLIAAMLIIPIYVTAVFLTLPFILITSWLIPLLMWLTIRWTEDLFQAVRSSISLTKLLLLPKEEYDHVKSIRENIREKVQNLAVNEIGLPENPEVLINKSRPRGMGYFSIRKRRKKDYNEVLRLWDVSGYD